MYSVKRKIVIHADVIFREYLPNNIVSPAHEWGFPALCHRIDAAGNELY